MKIEKDLRVRVQVMLKVKGGEVLEKSGIEYVHGGGTMLPGIEKVLENAEPGQEFKGTLLARDAFGAVELPKKRLKKSDFPKDATFELGQLFQAKSPDGQDLNFKIVDVGKDKKEIEVQIVHPLADKDIEYELKVITVTDPLPPPPPGISVDEDVKEDDIKDEGDKKKSN